VSLGIHLAEKGLLPDGILRSGIRRLVAARLREEDERGLDDEAFAALMRAGPVAPVPEKANEQHYEVPADFFRLVLGPHLKYSCCLFEDGVTDLGEAEAAALRTTAERAGIADGQRVLELGCGWGSFTLHAAESFPGIELTAVSNSAGQREHIEARARERGLENLRVVTADMNDFDAEGRFDRVVSVEMFEHMRNWGELLRRVSGWLEEDGRLFVHVCRHARLAYEFQTAGKTDWMGRHFFTGGIMPSEDLITRFDEDLRVRERWSWNGEHYRRTAEAWIENLDAVRAEARPVLARTYGEKNAALWHRRWRLFFLSCAELFGYRDGTEWGVSHYLLSR